MIDRRQMFMGAAAVLASPLPAVQAAPLPFMSASDALALALSVARDEEDPDLVQIGDDLHQARDRLQGSLDRLREAQDAALAAAPSIPEGLAVPFGLSIFGSLSWYTLAEPANILGHPITLPRYRDPRSGKEFPVRVPSTADIVRDRQSGRQVNGGHIPAWFKGEHRRLYDLARRHEEAIDAVRQETGLNAAEDERIAAEAALLRLCRGALSIQAKTVLGLLIKADTMRACEVLVSRSLAQDLCHNVAVMLPNEVRHVLGSPA